MGTCLLSNKCFWLRCRCNGETDSLSRLCQLGTPLRVTQVRHAHHSNSKTGIPNFETNELQSQMKKINSRGSVASKYEHLRLFQWNCESSFPVADVSFCCRIVNWRIAQEHSEGFTGFEIHALDVSRCTILLQYPVPSCLLHRKSLYPWLQHGACLFLRYTSVKEYDKKHDILIVARTEHTCVDLLSTTLLSRFPDGEIPSDVISQLNSFSLDVEDIRMNSLRSGEEYFQIEDNEEGLPVLESCERRRQTVQYSTVEYSGNPLTVTINGMKHRLDVRIASQLHKTVSSQLTGDVVVVNRRYFKDSSELNEEESVVVAYIPHITDRVCN